LNGFNKCALGGCHLDRPIRSSVEQGGFRFETVETFYLKSGPRFGGCITMGSAVKQ
jgi:hypothetical protein